MQGQFENCPYLTTVPAIIEVDSTIKCNTRKISFFNIFFLRITSILKSVGDSQKENV